MTSNRRVNEAIDKAREEGRLAVPEQTEPGSSLAKAPDLQQNYDQAQQATQPLEPATPGPTRPPITAAQQYDPIQALSQRQPAPGTAHASGHGDQAKTYSEDMKQATSGVKADQAAGQVPDPAIAKSLNEHDPDAAKIPFNRATNAQPPETHKEKLDRVTGDIRVEQQAADPAEPSYQDRLVAAAEKHRVENGRDSEMVKNQQPVPRLVPNGPGAQAVDAQAFNRDWSSEQSAADAYQDRIKSAHEKQQADAEIDQQPEPTRDFEQSR